METEISYNLGRTFPIENIGKELLWKPGLKFEIEYQPKKKDTDYNMSIFESKLYEDTLGEIARLESELDFLRQFLKLVGSSPEKPTQSISTPAKKSPAAKSAQRKTTKAKKPKLTEKGKKIGRPTNAEKEAKAKKSALIIKDGLGI
jgi:hypothetical protein